MDDDAKKIHLPTLSTDQKEIVIGFHKQHEDSFDGWKFESLKTFTWDSKKLTVETVERKENRYKRCITTYDVVSGTFTRMCTSESDDDSDFSCCSCCFPKCKITCFWF